MLTGSVKVCQSYSRKADFEQIHYYSLMRMHDSVQYITHSIYDPEVSPSLKYHPESNTIGRPNKYKLLNHTFHYTSLPYITRWLYCVECPE